MPFDPFAFTRAKADRRYNRLGVKARGMLCFVGDDQYDSHRDLLMPALEAIGGRGSIAYCSAFAGIAGHFSNADTLAMFQRGHEIANHTQHHDDLTADADSVIRTEIDNTQLALLGLLGERPTSLIYPFSNRNATTDYACFPRFERTFWGGNAAQCVIPLDSDVLPFAIPRFSWTTANTPAVMKLVERAYREPVRIVIYTHQISGVGLQLTEAAMDQVIDYAGQLGVPCVTLAEAFPAASTSFGDPLMIDQTLTDLWTVTTGGGGTNSAISSSQTGPSLFPTDATLGITRSIKISLSDVTGTRRYTAVNAFALRGGQPYSGKVEVILTKSSGIGGGYLMLDQYDAAGNFLSTLTLARAETDTAGAWTIIQGAVTTDPLAFSGQLVLYAEKMVGDVSFSVPWVGPCRETLIAGPSRAAAGWLGNGTDGACVFDGTSTVAGMAPSSNVYTMTQDLHATSIVVATGVTLKPANYLVFCRGKILNNGTIHNNGPAGSGSTGGTTPSNGTLVGGGNGGAGGTAAGSAGQAAQAIFGSGNAGAGGTGSSGAGGAAGTPTATVPIYRAYNPHPFIQANISHANSTRLISGAPGGGGGGGDGTAGGGGGAGGGILAIFADTIENNGTISANGGNGADASGGNRGGGGGGKGGTVRVLTRVAVTGSGTITASAGQGGVKQGTGTNGANGAAGNAIVDTFTP